MSSRSVLQRQRGTAMAQHLDLAKRVTSAEHWMSALGQTAG